ncbi:MAG: hypothetical protein WBC04_05715 [Candidatus Acidiferrales bacterium]
MRKAVKRYAIVLVAWLPFFVIWVFFTMSYARFPLFSALLTSMISMGSASLLGVAVWHVCQRWLWPLQLNEKFYLLRVNFFMTKFRKLGFIQYNHGGFQVHSSLLSVVLHE